MCSIRATLLGLLGPAIPTPAPSQRICCDPRGTEPKQPASRNSSRRNSARFLMIRRATVRFDPGPVCAPDWASFRVLPVVGCSVTAPALRTPPLPGARRAVLGAPADPCAAVPDTPDPEEVPGELPEEGLLRW